MLLFQNAELLSQRQVFQDQIAARAKTSSKKNDEVPQQAEQETSFTW